MEEIKVNKTDLLVAYSSANQRQKEILEKLYWKELFAVDWREITSYEKACDVLGIQRIDFNGVSDRPQYMKMIDATHQLLVICEAINGNGKWYDEMGRGYYPVFSPLTKESDMHDAELKNNCMHKLISGDYSVGTGVVGITYVYTAWRRTDSDTFFGFPVCLNSKEKAEFVGKQFFELCCACYGLTVKMDS